jgi:uncharacterized membrane protein YadS
LAIVPISLGLAAWRNRSLRGAHASLGATNRDNGLGLVGPFKPADRPRLALRRGLPLFIVAFLGAVACNSAGFVPATWHHGLSDLATWMITAALAAIGLSANTSHIRRAGPRPVLLGALLWATVAIASLALQVATGTI